MHIPLQVKPSPSTGFTLIEMSIVLVIIGLLVGGILAGQNLINTAAIRSQISQIEKYNTAVNTFRNKYGGLPGDLPDPAATQFGFQPRGAFAGEGDGNGLIEGNCANGVGNNVGIQDGCGELAVFWQDLSTAKLIDSYIGVGANYPSINNNPWPDITITSTPALKDWLPVSKLGQGNFIYLYSSNGINYFSVSSVNDIGWNIASTPSPGVTVQQAYNIDKKVDDGLPQSGNVTACYLNYNIQSWEPFYAAGGLVGQGTWLGNGTGCNPDTTATPYATTNCFDNNNVAGTQTYSVSKNANAQNCALSFKFQ